MNRRKGIMAPSYHIHLINDICSLWVKNWCIFKWISIHRQTMTRYPLPTSSLTTAKFARHKKEFRIGSSPIAIVKYINTVHRQWWILPYPCTMYFFIHLSRVLCLPQYSIAYFYLANYSLAIICILSGTSVQPAIPQSWYMSFIEVFYFFFYFLSVVDCSSQFIHVPVLYDDGMSGGQAHHSFFHFLFFFCWFDIIDWAHSRLWCTLVQINAC